MADSWRRKPPLTAAGVLLVTMVGVAVLLGLRRNGGHSAALSEDAAVIARGAAIYAV